MLKHPSNESGKKKTQLPQSMEGKEVNFPVRFSLKAVINAVIGDEENKEHLVNVFKSLEMVHSFQGKKISSKGNYVSYTYEVTVMDKAQMDKLYQMLKNVEGLKFAL